mmetsp:Transcript_16933/g.57286  ORF Transcript_16933/g.57286 Transcript_16933/m.57286 type:complete len:213 (+) Transcript_16933:632-1270(+)
MRTMSQRRSSACGAPSRAPSRTIKRHLARAASRSAQFFEKRQRRRYGPSRSPMADTSEGSTWVGAASGSGAARSSQLGTPESASRPDSSGLPPFAGGRESPRDRSSSSSAPSSPPQPTASPSLVPTTNAPTLMALPVSGDRAPGLGFIEYAQYFFGLIGLVLVGVAVYVGLCRKHCGRCCCCFGKESGEANNYMRAERELWSVQEEDDVELL